MKMFVLILAALAAAVCVSGCSFSASTPPEVGRPGAGLAPCPGSPNCVCSTDPASSAAVAPLRYDPALGDPMPALVRAVESLPGSAVVTRDATYLHATVTSRWLGFVDDLECQVAPDKPLIHIRSASRLGYYDFGANRRRAKALRRVFEGGE